MPFSMPFAGSQFLHPLRNTAGVGLTELMTALTIGLVVVSLSLDTLTHLETRFRRQHRQMAVAQDARLGLEVFEQDIRAAVGLSVDGRRALLRAEPRLLELRANMNGYETILVAAALVGQTELAVSDGSQWPAGKEVRICHRLQCVDNRLVRAGQRSTISLAQPLGESFSPGAHVFVVNHVRYSVTNDDGDHLKLMRQVDGGTATLIDDLGCLGFAYWTALGEPTSEMSQVRGLRLELCLGHDRRRITKDIAIQL